MKLLIVALLLSAPASALAHPCLGKGLKTPFEMSQCMDKYSDPEMHKAFENAVSDDEVIIEIEQTKSGKIRIRAR
jgi:hypothetical protein